jgi:uncharacterized phage-associated protein
MATLAPSTPANCASASTLAAVANEFLRLQREDPGHPPIDQMKLQKLLFYAHAWRLAMFDRQPLFDDDFEAWPWGPVVRGAYMQTLDYGRGPVTGQLSELVSDGGEVLFLTPQGVTDDLKSYVRNVWDVHKPYTGIQLSNSTHAPGEPWSIMKERYGSLESKPKIPNSLIAEVFEAKLRNAAGNSATAQHV